jgi:hypothetical protein
MYVSKIQGPSFGIYDHTHVRTVGDSTVRTITGYTGDKKISVFSQYENGILTGKLYYLEDKLLNFIKFKLYQIKNGKVRKLVRISEKLDQNF